MKEDGTNIRRVVGVVGVCVCGGSLQQHIICVLFLISTQSKRKHACVCVTLWAQQREGGFTESTWAHFYTFLRPLNHTLWLSGLLLMTLPPTLFPSLYVLLIAIVSDPGNILYRGYPTILAHIPQMGSTASPLFNITFESVSQSVILPLSCGLKFKGQLFNKMTQP